MYGWLELACVAVKVGSDWILLSGRALLRTKPCPPTGGLTPLVHLNELVAVSGSTPALTIEDLIGLLKDSWVIEGVRDYPIRLIPEKAPQYRWNAPMVYSLSQQSRMLAVKWGGFNLIDSITHMDWDEIDSRLRQGTPGFNGFDALCEKLGLAARHNNLTSSFEVAAELPARFVAVDVDPEKRSIETDIEYEGSPDLMIEWLPQHDLKRIRQVWQPDGGPIVRHISVAIPEDAVEADLALSFAKLGDADSLKYCIPPGSTLLRVSNFFDPGRSGLAECLYTKTDAGANAFELGIARLLSTAGFVVLWFGKATKDALPDIFAYWRSPLGREFTILAECTLKDPVRKLTDLANRGKRLCEEAKLDSWDLLVVVFTRVEATGADFGDAEQRGVILCDGGRLTRLEKEIALGVSPTAVYELLKEVPIQRLDFIEPFSHWKP